MSGPVVVRCPSCSQKYRIPSSAIGRRARCKRCQTVFAIGPRQGAANEDTVVSWVTEDDPSSQSVMGATGIFQNPPTPAASAEPTEAKPAVPTSTVVVGESALVLRTVDADGAHFEFPASLLASPALRNAFPRRCIGCGDARNLRIHLIHWPERMEVHDAASCSANPGGRVR